tara:strand:+ start:154 stop:786 length:633 start_codon:yes stop_codon:yes gene_type:complete
MINIRHAYDQELERIIERNEYLINPEEQPFKPSYLDYNYYGMKPMMLDRLTGFDRVLQEYHLNNRKKITRLNEEDCMKLLKFIFPDIYKIKTHPTEDWDRIDYHVPSHNLFIDHKKRNKFYYQEDGGMTLDRPKYEELMKEENGYILNSTDIGLFMWNVKLLGDIEWIYQENTPVETEGTKRIGETEPCEITYLDYNKCNDLTYLLLQYT